MLFKIEVRVSKKSNVPDAEAAKIWSDAQHSGILCLVHVRVGKTFELEVDAEDAQDAEVVATLMCMNLLANHNIEDHTIVSVRPG